MIEATISEFTNRFNGRMNKRHLIRAGFLVCGSFQFSPNIQG